jgi:thiol-disulfide isomerase/thioredoxin
MRTTRPPTWLLTGCLALLLLSGASCAHSQENADRYTVPKTNDPQKLLAFIEELSNFRPNTPLESLEHRKQAPKAMFLAADRILEVAKDQSSDAYRIAVAITVSRKVSGLYVKSPAEQAEQYAQWKKLFDKATWGEYDISTAKAIAEAFEEAGNYSLAAQAYDDFARMLEGKRGAQAKQARQLFEGSARRVKLPGHVLELTGTRYDGQKFDLKSLRGKVVLIDFFATWCGPCLEEVPNLQKAYREYHERGFEIVSISIDEDRDALDGFLKRKKLPWILLHEKEEAGQHPAMDYYGIEGIPAMFLVDREGKVVSLNARGEELQKLLKKMLPAE